MNHILTNEERKKGLEKAHSSESRQKATETRKTNILVRKTVNNAFKDFLLSKNKKGVEYYNEFLINFMNSAKLYPNSNAGMFMAERLIPEEVLKELDATDEKDTKERINFIKFKIQSDFFKQQRDVILDTNHYGKIVVCCSRRAGKTELSTGAILTASLIPESRIIYINLTFTNAINQIWNDLLKRAEDFGISIESSSKSEGNIIFSNGSSLRIMGNPNNSELEKLRGEKKVSLIIIDEFFHQKNMEYGINEIISPLLTDRKDSTLICIGTPPRLAKTYGEKVWNENGWKKYHWTMFDNPYIPEPKEFLQKLCVDKGITEDSPFIQREFYGVIGSYDTEALIFKDRKTYTKDIESEIKKGAIKITGIAIGVDYGFSDFNSIVTVAYNKDEKKSYVIEESKFNKSTVSVIIEAIKKHYENAKNIINAQKLNKDCVKIYCDTNEESITADLRVNYSLPAFNCYKYDKDYAIELLAEELRTGRMQIKKNDFLDEEMQKVLHPRDEDGNILPGFDEEEGEHTDITMALLYASRKIFFDMNYDIKFKESIPKTSDWNIDENGTITSPNWTSPNAGDFENIGTIG